MRACWGWESGEVREHFGHAGGEPAVAAAPVVGSGGGVEEEAVGLLEFVEVERPFRWQHCGRGIFGRGWRV